MATSEPVNGYVIAIFEKSIKLNSNVIFSPTLIFYDFLKSNDPYQLYYLNS